MSLNFKSASFKINVNIYLKNINFYGNEIFKKKKENIACGLKLIAVENIKNLFNTTNAEYFIYISFTSRRFVRLYVLEYKRARLSRQ